MRRATLTAQERSSYLEQIRRFPILTADEECTLATRWRDCRDRYAADQLATSYLRLVAKIAMGYRRYGLAMSDLIAEGNVGLMRAIKRFEGARFSTYAIWWIKAEIQDYILRSRSLVRIGTTRSQKRLFFNLSNAKSRLCANHEGDLGAHHVSLIANELGDVEKDVVEMNRRLRWDVSLNLPLNEDGSPVEWEDRLV